ncbi:MAG: M1 family aminopeptidase [Myxococcota bacterium]
MTLLNAEHRLHTRLSLSSRAKGEFASPLAEPQYAPELRLEPVHLVLDFQVDLDANTLAGSVTHTIRCNSAGATELSLHGLELTDLRVAEDNLDWTYDGSALALTWKKPFEEGETRTVTVHYRVEQPRSGLFFSKPTDAAPDAPLFAVTDHETERARHWLCTVDLPAVRPTLEIRLRAKADLVILANGRLAGEENHGDGTKTATWVLDAPCPSYLTCFAIGDFVRWDGGEVDGAPVAAFAPRSKFQKEHLERAFRRTADMLAWLPKQLGEPYPYPKYFQFAVPGIGGAMENISLVSWDDRFLLDEALETEERQLLDVINVHEMAHTWFGDHIVCRDYAHAWLKESWATYIETCWLEHDLGKDAADYDLWASARNYIRESDERYKRPIVTRHFDSSWDMYDYHLYPGGAWRLHMLRKSLGEETFWRAVRTYVGRYAGKVVETDDFRRVLEEISGRSLERFFDQWLRSPGHPKLKGRFRYSTAKKEGTFELEQTQVDKKRGVALFDFDIDLAYWIDGERHVRTVAFRSKKITQVIPMEKDPERVRIDPDLNVLHDLDFDVGDTRLKRQLAEDDVWGRILAGRALATSGKRANVAAVAAQLRKEAYWGVQIQLAEALGGAGTDGAVDALASLVREHAERQSLAAVFRAAGRYRDPRLRDALVERSKSELPPRATEALHDALGAQRGEAPFELLRDASERKGFGGHAQAGALRALAGTRDERALDVLIARSQPAAIPTTVRPHAAAALGTLVRRLDRRPQERGIETLIDLLRDESAKVRSAAAHALCNGRVRQAAGALERYAQTLPAQEAVQLRRRIAGLRRGDRGVRQAEKRIEELEGRLRKLTDRLEKLEQKQSAK